MTRAFALVLTSCLMGAASLVAARERPASTASKAEAQDAATLASVNHPEALNNAVVTYTVIHVVIPTYHDDSGLQALEADHPAIVDAMIAAMQSAFERSRREALPRCGRRQVPSMQPD